MLSVVSMVRHLLPFDYMVRHLSSVVQVVLPFDYKVRHLVRHLSLVVDLMVAVVELVEQVVQVVKYHIFFGIPEILHISFRSIDSRSYSLLWLSSVCTLI